MNLSAAFPYDYSGGRHMEVKMPGRVMWQMVFSVALLLGVARLYAGGWAVVTVVELPDVVRAGESFELSYAVRQHGVGLMSGLDGRITATLDEQVVSVRATPLPQAGYYTAKVTVPRDGPWAVRIEHGFGTFFELPPLQILAVARSAAAPPPAPVAERGRQLFVAKGCVTCHVHEAVGGESLSVGPDLTSLRRGRADLERLLTPGFAATQQSKMPDLGLRTGEIEALVTFFDSVSGRRQLTTAR
jgi:mono/diheme cytochrome c family protein